MKPSALKKGDTIGIAAPASPFVREDFLEGVKTLEAMGFKIYHREDIFDRMHYLAGSDKRRAEELTEMMGNPKVKAVFFARGGYGMMRILPYLDQSSFKDHCKIILGYSDITSFLIYLNQKYGWTTFYGPVVAKDLCAKTPEITCTTLLDAITKTTPVGPYSYPETVCIKPGSAEGIITGGCLSLLVASLGTPYEIDTDGKILFFEDTNEKPYSVDRMLTQLVLAGKINKAKGLLFGNFVNGGNISHIQEAIADVLGHFNGPILYNFPAGHGPTKVTLPLGIRVRLSADQNRLEYLESACL